VDRHQMDARAPLRLTFSHLRQTVTNPYQTRHITVPLCPTKVRKTQLGSGAFAVKYAISIFIMTFVSAWAQAVPSVIPVCGDEDSWPPYLRFQTENGIVTNKPEGYALDFARLILDKKGVEFSVDMLPWQRCLNSAKQGRHAMVLNAMYTIQRDLGYLTTRPLYSLTAIYIYRSDAPAPRIQQATDLSKYRLCGLHGYDYQPFSLDPGQVDQGARTFEQVVDKLKYKRCDMLIGHFETISERSKSMTTPLFQDPQFAYAKVPGLAPLPYVMLVSRNTPYAYQLLAMLNEGIAQAIDSPEDKRLKKKWNIDWK